jgi:signal transduction histidine kinase
MQLDTSALLKGKLTLVKPGWPVAGIASLTPGTIHFNQKNELLVLSDNREIIRHRNNGSILRIPFPETGLSPNFYIDREDVLWLCDDGTGVYKLPDTKLQSVSSYLENNKSGIRTVTGITPDFFWIVMNNGQWILHTGTGSKNFRTAPAFDAYFIHAAEKYLYASNPHNLFIAPLPKQNENTLYFKKVISVPDTVGFGGISATDKNGNTIVFETRNIIVMQDDHQLFSYSLLPSDLVQGMYIDAKNRLWVISRYNGLQIFSLHPENHSAYLKEEFRFKGLMGFIFKNNQLKNVAHFQTNDGLTDNFITSLACDGNNNVIIGTQTGLDRLIKTGNGYRLENVTGSNNIFTYIQTVWTDRQNNIFAWTSANGILKAEPAEYAAGGFEPQLLIGEIKVNGKATVFLKTPLQLKYQQRNITFSVAAPAFIDEKQVKYSYLLSGSGNNEWSDTTNNADITLLNLSPGSYTLHVKAFFPSTAYSSKETEFSFSILPPWWQTWWFRVIAGLLIIGLLIIAVRIYYRRKLEKQTALLEKQKAIEKERTRIATDMHDDLGAGLSTIRFLSEKVKRNSFSDVTKGDAEKIVTNSNDLVQKMNEIIWAMNEKNDTLEDLLYYTRSYAAEYCEENNLTCETHLPQNIPSIFVSGEIRRNVFLTVKESLHNIVKHASAEKVVIDFNINSSLLVTVKDDGKGFSENRNDSGNGLRNMQKRMESVNGSFEIINSNGVVVKIKVPLQL